MTVSVICNYVNKFNDALDSVNALINSRKLSTLGEVYLQSYYPGWASSTQGPKGGHLVHTTGGTASAPTVPPAAGAVVETCTVAGTPGTFAIF